MDLLKRRCLGEFRCRITQNFLIRRTVVKPPPLHIDQRNHIGGILGNDLKELFALLRLPPSQIHAELLVNYQDAERAESDPVPLRHYFVPERKNVRSRPSRRLSANIGRTISRLRSFSRESRRSSQTSDSPPDTHAPPALAVF